MMLEQLAPKETYQTGQLFSDGRLIPNSEHIEGAIRAKVLMRGIRVSEFFHDFDRLNSGRVTKSQFIRCIDRNTNIKLTPIEAERLTTKYADDVDPNMVNYRHFCDSIDQVICPHDVSTDPATKTFKLQPYFDTERSVRVLDPQSEERLINLLLRLQQYFKYHGVSIKTCYEDFDANHIGVISANQFRRNFPGPTDVTEDDVEFLADKYTDLSRPTMINYINFHHDVEHCQEWVETRDIVNESTTFPPEGPPPLHFESIMGRIRGAVHRDGIRIMEYFRDYDKLRSGLVTDSQFIRGLSVGVAELAKLTPDEVQLVTDKYATYDGRVLYKDFCNDVLEADRKAEFESNPNFLLTHPVETLLPKPTTRWKPTALLSAEEEQRVNQIIEDLSKDVSKRRLMLFQYFKDFDRQNKEYSQCMTKSQFGRMLHFLSLEVSKEDLDLLCRKFRGPDTIDVYYPLFVQAVDKDFFRIHCETEDPAMKVGQFAPDWPILHRGRKVSITAFLPYAAESQPREGFQNVQDLVVAINQFVRVNGLVVADCFQGFDKLRSEVITQTQFRRGLSTLGLSAIGKFNFSQSDFNLLTDFYADPENPDNIQYTRFVRDVNDVLHPAFHTRPISPPLPLKSLSDEELAASAELCQNAMDKLRCKIQQRRILLRPTLQDFDKTNNGHVKSSRFKQCLRTLDLMLTEEEYAAIERKFVDDLGFNYILFLQEVDPEVPIEPKYHAVLEERKMTNTLRHPPEDIPPSDYEQVMSKIKSKVWRERIRILEFLSDYDKLRTGRIPKLAFRRALNLSTVRLSLPEMIAIEKYYQSVGFPDCVDYAKFVDDIESIFRCKEMEQYPGLQVEEFHPPSPTKIVLPEEVDAILHVCLHRLAEKVRTHRTHVLELFEELDKWHNGVVTPSQFRHVISQTGCYLNDNEFKALMMKYDASLAGRYGFAYIDFCKTINDLAQVESERVEAATHVKL